MNQDTTLPWLLAHTTMYCGKGGEHMAHSSAMAHAKQREEAPPDDWAFAVVHQALALTYLSCLRKESIKEDPSKTVNLSVEAISPDSGFLLNVKRREYREQWFQFTKDPFLRFCIR